MLTNKNETKCGLHNRNYAKMSLHFRWPKQDETKCYNVISSRLVVLLLFCSISVSCLTSGLQGCQVFETKPAQLLFKTSPNRISREFPGKVRIPGAKYHVIGIASTRRHEKQPAATVLKYSNSAGKPRTWQHSAQTQATPLPQAPLAALFRRRQQTKLSMTQRKGPMAGFIWLQFTSNKSNRHTHFICTF